MERPAEELRDFLDEYSALCRKHGFIVTSCGCCDGPWTEDEVDDERIRQHINHLEQEGIY